MTTNGLVRLTTAVRRLTRKYQVVVEDHDGVVLGLRTEIPLLTRLAEGVVGSNNGGAAGGSGEKRSTPMHVQAVDLQRRILVQYQRQFVAELGLIGRERPEGFGSWPVETVITRWAMLVSTAYTRGLRLEVELVGAARMVERTIRTIEDLFDPPYTFDLTGACPECDVEYVTGFNEAEGHATRRNALRVTERVPLSESHVDCGACHHRWTGISEARRLSVLLDAVQTTY